MRRKPIGGARIARTVDAAEIARFAKLADTWWDETGPMAPLHAMNPVRMAFIRDRLCRHFDRDPALPRPFEGLKAIDVGCGGGVLSEPMSRLGAAVTGIDAAEANVGIAKAHAEAMGLAIDYRHAAIEDLASESARFDVVLLMEIVEHVADLDAFLAAATALLRPGGLIVVSTLNRTMKAFALAIVGAEYVLGWLPKGTHDWRKFVKPSELAAAVRKAGLRTADVAGMSYDPFAKSWTLSRDASVNYLFAASA